MTTTQSNGPGTGARCLLLATCALLVAGCAGAPESESERVPSGVLYVWSADADEQDPDFLAVVDVRRESPTYGHVLHSVPVDGRGNWPHHTEYELAPGGTLLANGWGTGRTFVFDVTNPLAPTVRNTFAARAGYAYPHSYARLPNGHVLATFQTRDGGYTASGGLVELDETGAVVRSASAVSPDVPANENWTYSLLVLPDLDRVVTTNTRMGLTDEWKAAAPAATDAGHQHVSENVSPTHVQIWRLSDLSLLHTLRLPPQDGGHNARTAEPRRLANGEVFVNTFTCGLYHLTGLTSDQPAAEPVLWSPLNASGWCAVPVVLGNLWIQPSATERAIVSYYLGDPANPRLASRLVLDSAFVGPHWLALDPGDARLVVTSEKGAWVLMVNVDPVTGALSIDENFRDPGASRPGVWFDRQDWPHGAAGRAMPHGAVFGPGPTP
ncbi:MAG TPA: selenium-binding protein SBP56-related protein [Gemmatimonadaceae bacterium]